MIPMKTIEVLSPAFAVPLEGLVAFVASEAA
jgi:hypothetical protein